jgi:hypothetical protein
MRRAIPTIILVLLTACSGNNSDPVENPTDDHGTDSPAAATLERPETFSALPEITLLSPSPTGAGPVPVFSWRPVDGAASYRISVLGQQGPIWAWLGDNTEVRMGGLDAEPAPGAGGILLTEPAYWTVAALTEDGRVIALSGLSPVSPDDNPTSWVPGAVTEAPEQSPAPTPKAEEEFSACGLLTTEELSLYLETEPTVGEAETLADGQYYGCEWQIPDDELSYVSIEIYTGDQHWNPTGWAGPDYETVEGLGEDSFAYLDWGGWRVGILRDGRTIYLTTGLGPTKEVQTLELARQIDTRLQESGIES